MAVTDEDEQRNWDLNRRLERDLSRELAHLRNDLRRRLDREDAHERAVLLGRTRSDT